jgi:hypothetical protein
VGRLRPRRDAWVWNARAGRQRRRLELHAETVSRPWWRPAQIRESVRNARSGLDALWLTSNTALTGDPSLLSYLIEQAWLRRVVVFSETLDHAQAGVLFAPYPDTEAPWENIRDPGAAARREPARRSASSCCGTSSSRRQRPCQALGLLRGQEDLRRFDRVLDAEDRMSPRDEHIRERLREHFPRPAALGILLLAVGAFSSVSWFMYAQFSTFSSVRAYRSDSNSPRPGSRSSW